MYADTPRYYRQILTSVSEFLVANQKIIYNKFIFPGILGSLCRIVKDKNLVAKK